VIDALSEWICLATVLAMGHVASFSVGATFVFRYVTNRIVKRGQYLKRAGRLAEARALRAVFVNDDQDQEWVP
jgi:hypothetical protein